jgi:hypothetical protein
MDDNPSGVLSSTSTSEVETAAKPVVTFEGNNYDLAAVVGVTIGGIVLLSCATCNLGFYVLPFLPIILGLVGLLTAKDSVNPERTKLLSWLSLGSGALILLLILLLVIAYIAIIVIAIASEGESF